MSQESEAPRRAPIENFVVRSGVRRRTEATARLRSEDPSGMDTEALQRLADDLQVQVTGTGQDGRVLKSDLVKALRPYHQGTQDRTGVAGAAPATGPAAGGTAGTAAP